MKTLSPVVPTVIICPGNGCSNIRRCNWYGYLADQLERHKNIPCVCRDFPDPLRARRDIWIPHIRRTVQDLHDNDDHVVLVGHSSGAQAALRYTEQYPVVGVVLVSATYSDLGDAGERASGYYPQQKQHTGGNGNGNYEENAYDFAAMRRNCPHWYQFHSDDDPFIPVREAEQIRDGLGLNDDEYSLLAGRSHFFEPFPELLPIIERICMANVR